MTSAAAGFAAVAHVIDPNEPGFYPICPWFAFTGTYCPGCGTLRATHALTNGNLAEALQRNPLTVLVWAAIIIALTRWAWLLWTDRSTQSVGESGRNSASRASPDTGGRGIRPWVLWIGVAAVTCYWVARNVPGWTWLSPQ